MASVREADGGFSIPLAHAMYYIWGTRMLRSDFRHEFAFYPFLGEWKEADLHRKALASYLPSVSVSGKPGKGSLGNEVRLIELDSQNVILSALYSQDGKIYARMYECQGRSGSALLAYRRGSAQLHEVNLLGGEEGPAANPLSFQSWQIRTFRVAVPIRR